MPFAATGNRHGRAFPQVPSDSRPLRHATRRRRASSTIYEFVADERGKFSAAQASRTRKTRKESRYGRASFAPLVAPSRACPEMAPQRLEKIESAPENGMAFEVSNPQHLVHGCVAHRALRRNSLGPPPTARRPQFTNSKRSTMGNFSASQPPEIAQTGKESRRRSRSVATVYEFDARERREKALGAGRGDKGRSV